MPRDPKVKLRFPAYVIPAVHVPEKTLTVTRCGECPYAQGGGGMGEPGTCKHHDAPKGFYEHFIGVWLPPPQWCPGRIK